jgi:hypothetical protein
MEQQTDDRTLADVLRAYCAAHPERVDREVNMPPSAIVDRDSFIEAIEFGGDALADARPGETATTAIETETADHI